MTQGGVLAYRALGQAGPGALQRACPSGHTGLLPHVGFQANIAEVEVSIPARLHNSLIGTKGRLIRSIMEECGGVHIHFPVEGSGSDTVVIRGPSSDVEKARKQLLHLAEEKVSAGRGGLCSHPAGGPAQPVSAAG